MAESVKLARTMKLTKDTRQLNWFLAWAVGFCDIGTSVYYVPGVLYGHVKDATPFFVLLTQSRGWRRSDDRSCSNSPAREAANRSGPS